MTWMRGSESRTASTVDAGPVLRNPHFAPLGGVYHDSWKEAVYLLLRSLTNLAAKIPFGVVLEVLLITCHPFLVAIACKRE